VTLDSVLAWRSHMPKIAPYATASGHRGFALTMMMMMWLLCWCWMADVTNCLRNCRIFHSSCFSHSLSLYIRRSWWWCF